MGRQLHVFFFPFMAHGHMIPTLDLAKLFAARGVRSTIVTTPLNAPYFSKSIQRANGLGLEMSVRTIRFPATESGLPENCEHVDQLTSDVTAPMFFKATVMLKQPLEDLLRECRPDCLVADMFFPWATGVAAKFNIPRLVFHGMGFFSLSTQKCLSIHQPQLTVSSDDEPFIVPNLPHEIKLTRKQMYFGAVEEESDFGKFLKQVRESDGESFGVVVNSFYELEPEYADHYRNVMGVKSWHVGPVSLCNKDIEDKSRRGKEASVGELHECLKWLDSKEPNSVIYVCFGSVVMFTTAQMFELAMGIEASGHHFIWVVGRKSEVDGDDEEKWFPEGFKERNCEKGLIIRGWAPQVLILDHEAVGGFVTHCGWNSILEGVSAGLPLVTWPSFAEQFFNEKLVTQVLRIGVSVGDKWTQPIDGIGREAIAKAIQKIIMGQEAEDMRKRARALKDEARKAIEEGGSSHSNLNALLQELSIYQAPEKFTI